MDNIIKTVNSYSKTKKADSLIENIRIKEKN